VISASIIIPCFNQLEFTRHCLRALFRNTRSASGGWELIVIDNGSTDGTGTYLAGVQDSAPAPVTIISNSTNRGFPAAINEGLRMARGEYLVLLNNDAVVTDSWLDQLIALAELEGDSTTKDTKSTKRETVGDGDQTTEVTETTEGERQGEGKEEGTTNRTNLTNEERNGDRQMTIGLAGPMSNYASPPQLVQNVPYHGMEEMQRFALRWREAHRGQWFTAAKLSGFCLLMKRAVYETIGGLDERFGLGLFDDDLAV
jgi:GT2 family glycosyltransferase